MDSKILDYGRIIHMMAQDEMLAPEHALEFCRDYLHQFIAEIELAARMTDAKATALFGEHLASLQPKVEPKKTAPKRRRKPAPKPVAKKKAKKVARPAKRKKR